MRTGHVEIEYSLLQQLVGLAERGVNDLEEQLSYGAKFDEEEGDVAPGDLEDAISCLREAQQLL